MKLSQLRRRSGYTQAGAAARLKIKPRTLAAYEGGTRVVPGKRIKDIASLYEVNLEEAYKAAYGDGKEGG